MERPAAVTHTAASAIIIIFFIVLNSLLGFDILHPQEPAEALLESGASFSHSLVPGTLLLYRFYYAESSLFGYFCIFLCYFSFFFSIFGYT